MKIAKIASKEYLFIEVPNDAYDSLAVKPNCFSFGM